MGDRGLSGAEYLASIFGTEKDKVNCSFFFKMGACRHGDKCSRIHNKPTFSQTVLLQNMYINPKLDVRQAFYGLKPMVSADAALRPGSQVDPEEQAHFDSFFEEVFCELEDQYGEIEEMNVCDNLGEHMIGNVYVKFRKEEDAQKAVDGLNKRWFAGNPVYAELSPVSDFREACCRQFEMGECTKGGFCNFMHLKPISRDLRRRLYGRRRGAGGYYVRQDDHPDREAEERRDRERDERGGKRMGPGGGYRGADSSYGRDRNDRDDRRGPPPRRR